MKGKKIMKTKTMRKALSLFLAVLMIALALPLTLLPVSAEDDIVGIASLFSAGSCQLLCHRLTEYPALRCHENHFRVLAAQLFNSLENRLTLHEHALTAAAEVIIRAAVFVVRPVAQLVCSHGDDAAVCRSPHDALGERPGYHLRKQSQYVNLKHERKNVRR